MNKDFFTSNRFMTVGYKILVYGLPLFLLIVAQCTLFARLSVFGAIPDLALAATVTIAIKDGERAGAVFGIASGFLTCALGGGGAYLYIIFSFAAAYGAHLLASRIFSVNYPSFLTYCVIAFGAKALFNIAQAALRAESFDFVSTLTGAVLPEFLISLVFCSPIYFAFGALTKIFAKKHLYKGDS